MAVLQFLAEDKIVPDLDIASDMRRYPMFSGRSGRKACKEEGSSKRISERLIQCDCWCLGKGRRVKVRYNRRGDAADNRLELDPGIKMAIELRARCTWYDGTCSDQVCSERRT